MGFEKKGLIFNIQGYSVHDGPGIRTELFMKGCPLSCEWCSNPEGMRVYPETGVDGSKCIGLDNCQQCLKACKQEALLVSAENKIVAIDRDKCIHCQSCAARCPSGALKPWGIRYSVDEIMERVLKDKVFFDTTGGGVTISGGEALLQKDFVIEVFKRCKEFGIHTCLESALHVPSEVVEEVLPYADMVISDIKSMNAEVHKARCGVEPSLIHKNLKIVAQSGTDLVIRTPVLKGFNATDDDIKAIGQFILDELDNKVVQYQLLPYRVMGTEKYKSLNRPYPMEDFEGYEREEWEPDFVRFIGILESMGINAVTGMHQKLPSRKKPY